MQFTCPLFPDRLIDKIVQLSAVDSFRLNLR